MAEKKKMTVAEMLAAARKADSAAGGADAPAAQAAAPGGEAAPAEEAPVAETPAAETPAEKPPAKAKPAAAPGARMSVAEMMAAARAEKEKKGAAAPAPKKEPVAKKESPAPAKTPVKAAPKEGAAAAKAVPPKAPKEDVSTASILGAARAAAQPGPLSKAEAAAKPAAAKPAPKAESTQPKRPLPPMPVKPEYAKPKPKPAVEEERRTFMAAMMGALVGSSLGLGFTTLSTTFGLWTLGTARFMFPNILTEPPSKFKVGFPSNFAPGQVETRFVATFGVWVVNSEYNGLRQIYALKTVCTHLGCTPNWLEGEQKFKCPCHGSGFYKDGINFEGPAPRPLERYAIRLADDGQIEIDKSKIFLEEIGQWSDASSFVPV
jgi:cytochrome b6-f complex iron-sulfur subunit